MWVDSICINQKDTTERNQQVEIMGSIYSGAKEVFCWLSTCADVENEGRREPSPAGILAIEEALSTIWDGDLSDPGLLQACLGAQKLPARKQHLQNDGRLDEINTTASQMAALGLIHLVAKAQGERHLHELPFFEEHMDSKFRVANEFLPAFQVLKKLAEDPWWSRAWVIQESILPAKVSMVYHDIIMPIELLANFSIAVGGHIEGCCLDLWHSLPEDQVQALRMLVVNVHKIDRFRRTRGQLTGKDLLRVLWRFRDQKATNPRDKVYAFLGLIGDRSDIGPLVPSYTSSILQVYLEATVALLETGSLRVLGGHIRPHPDSGLPSWVQDWATPHQTIEDTSEQTRLFEAWECYRASRDESVVFRRCGDSALAIDGIGVDTVSAVSSTTWGDGARKSVVDMRDTFVEWEKLAGREHGSNKPYYFNGERWQDAFCFTLSTDLIWFDLDIDQKTWLGPPYESGFQRASVWRPQRVRDWWCATKYETGPISWQDWNRHTHSVSMRMTKSKRFFLTQEGKMGLGPPTLSPGDRVYILRGGNMPFLLRSSEAREGGSQPPPDPRYQLLGDCYIHGIMNGEALGGTAGKWETTMLY